MQDETPRSDRVSTHGSVITRVGLATLCDCMYLYNALVLVILPRMDAPDVLTVKQAAALLQVTERTIRNYIESGLLPALRMGPRLIRIRRADLERLFSEATA